MYMYIAVLFLPQVFFHYSELVKGSESDMVLGASVQFTIQNRQVSPVPAASLPMEALGRGCM